MAPGRRRPAQEPMKAGNGFALVLKSRYLRLIALLLVLLNIVNTVGEYILGQAVVTTADAQPPLERRLRQGGLHRHVLRQLLLLDQRGHDPPPGLRRLADRQALRHARASLLALPVVALCAYGTGGGRARGSSRSCST